MGNVLSNSVMVVLVLAAPASADPKACMKPKDAVAEQTKLAAAAKDSRDKAIAAAGLTVVGAQPIKSGGGGVRNATVSVELRCGEQITADTFVFAIDAQRLFYRIMPKAPTEGVLIACGKAPPEQRCTTPNRVTVEVEVSAPIARYMGERTLDWTADTARIVYESEVPRELERLNNELIETKLRLEAMQRARREESERLRKEASKIMDRKL